MMRKPLVSILIPVYKRAELAIEAIDSALSQDYENIEIIIGDNCSEDGTFHVLQERYKYQNKIILFQNEHNLGAVENWKRCLERSNGTFVKFLWSDDLMENSFISKAVMMFERDKEIAFVYSSVLLFQKKCQLDDKKLLRERYLFEKKTGIYTSDAFLEKTYKFSYLMPVSPGCALFRKESIRILDNVPNRLSYDHKKNGAGIDLLVFLEALSGVERFGYINEPLNYFREHPLSISSFDTSIRIGYWTAKIYFLREHGIEKFWKDMNAEIIALTNHKDIYNRKTNADTLSKYYGKTAKETSKYSIVKVFIWKVRYKLYTLSLRRFKRRNI